MPNVGYWTAPGDVLALQAPVIVSSLDHTLALEKALGDRYVSEYFGLRPELLLAVHIERDCGIAFWRSACRDGRTGPWCPATTRRPASTPRRSCVS